MNFPIKIQSHIQSHNGNFNREIILYRGLTVLIGPNGGGKTHLLRGLKKTLPSVVQGKKVRFLSAGRMGLLEQFRSDYDGQRGDQPRYEDASFGAKRDLSRRHLTETLNGDFQTLSERADILIKVQERLRKLFKRDLIIEWDAGSLKIVFARLDETSKPYSSGREASGLLHLVGILAALYDDEVGAILIDEPEVSLHPQLQSFLLNEIYSAAGHPSEGGYKKIIIIATHSTEMLRINRLDDLLSLVFCHDLNKPPVQLNADLGELKNKKLQTLVARLGQEHKLSLFCRRPLLVEGPSDVLVTSFLSNKLELHLEAAGSQLLPVIGKGQMPVVAKLMRLLGKQPVVLADADAFVDDMDLTNSFLSSSQEANEKANQLGASSACSLAASVYSDYCRLISNHWSDIAEYAQNHPYWINRSDIDELKAKNRSAFCSLLEISEQQVSSLNNSKDWASIKSRIIVVLDILELSGCFILRKGAIESYYQISDKFTVAGKPTAAVEEIDHLENFDCAYLRANFSDIIRCIEYASLGENINEVESLRDILLSIAAPSLARLKLGAKTQDIQILARTILGERSKIFICTVEDGQLKINMNSKILNVTGFPITISHDDDVIRCVNKFLSSNA